MIRESRTPSAKGVRGLKDMFGVDCEAGFMLNIILAYKTVFRGSPFCILEFSAQ